MQEAAKKKFPETEKMNSVTENQAYADELLLERGRFSSMLLVAQQERES